MDYELLNFPRAFDAVRDCKLKKTLKLSAGIKEDLRTLKGKLTSRKQGTYIRSVSSNFGKITSVASEGSVLGALIFLFYLGNL